MNNGYCVIYPLHKGKSGQSAVFRRRVYPSPAVVAAGLASGLPLSGAQNFAGLSAVGTARAAGLIGHRLPESGCGTITASAARDHLRERTQDRAGFGRQEYHSSGCPNVRLDNPPDGFYKPVRNVSS